MKINKLSKAKSAKTTSRMKNRDESFPTSKSVGYQIRTTHRLLQRFLQLKIEPYGVTLGMWWFLRALWAEDGLTQRELSRRVGTMEPTTLSAILAMEKRGYVRRARNKEDRRKLHVYLTPKGRSIEKHLIPLAKEVVATAVQGLSARDVRKMLEGLAEIQKNLHATISQHDEINSKVAK